VERVKPNWVIFSVLAVLAGILPRTVLACTRISVPPLKVKTTFVVFVHDPTGKPLSQAKIGVYEFIRKPPHSELVASAVTDKDGKAEIGGLHDNYSIGAALSGVSSEIVQIDVYDDGSGSSEIGLTWPGGPITEIQNVSGVLALGKGKGPWIGVEVALKDSVPNKSVGGVETDSQGRFKIPGVPPGFYALHVRAKIPNPARLPQLEGDIPIQVSDSAVNYELPTWGFVAGSCGLAAYKDADSMIIFSP
jgi:hypothetical protein